MIVDGFEIARAKIDILEFVREHVNEDVRRRGSLHCIPCPRADGDSDPSFVIYPDHFHCYHCGDWHGSIIDLVMGLHNYTAIEALEYLAKLYPDIGIEIGSSSGTQKYEE